MSGVFIAIGVAGVLAFVAFALLQRGREGFDLSPRGLLRLYLYVASLAAVIVLTLGIASATNAALGHAFGPDFVYGSSQQPGAMPARPCPPGERCPAPEDQQRFLEEQRQRERQEHERRRAEDLIRGVTFAAFGAVFFGAHWAARRGLIGPEERASALFRGYAILGTAIFGLTAVVALPMGVYQAVANAVLPLPGELGGSYRPGADSLGIGLASLAVWLVYLRLAVRELRAGA
jgi:hypothetical protein